MNVFWLLVVLATTIWVVRIIQTEGFDQNISLLFIPLVAAAWFVFRYKFNKRMQDRFDQNQN